MSDKPDKTAFTPRNVTKKFVITAVRYKVSSLTKALVADHTGLDEDDLIVKLGALAVAWGVSDAIKPYSDKAVDKTADWIVAQRAKRAEKKSEEKNPEEN